MLIEFSVKNHRSLWEKQTLSLVAGPNKDLLESNTFATPVEGLPHLLRSAVVYGANGSGKSNLIKSLAFMKGFVLSSSKERQEGERILRKPFLLHPEGRSQSSEFEVVFVQDDVRYQYGFAVIEERVTDEWLFVYPGNRAQRWFERAYSPDKKADDWYFGAKLSGPKKTWQESTRPNALFLSTAVQLNSEQLQPVYRWFQRLAVIGHGEQIDKGFTAENCGDKEQYEHILGLLKGGGIDVDAIMIEEKKLQGLNFPPDMPEELKSIVQRDLEGQTVKVIFFRHQLSNSQDFALFPLAEESDGTQKLFAYAAPWLDMLHKGRVLVVDELDNSFHPQLVRYLLRLIHDPQTNTANGQLIFSTHDTSILDAKILRRDQVWFMESDANKASRLYPLTEFHPRKNEALERGYLQGKFGAVPYIGELKS